MVGTSLSDDGVELLGQRRGLQAYVSTHRTMGIPILYPWANRLSSNGYGVDGAVVTLTPGTGGVRTDQHGVPIHGTLAALPGLACHHPARIPAHRRTGLRSPSRPAGHVPVPAPGELDITLADRTLTVRTTVTATTGARVPLCFGFHPYLQLPDVPRAEWQIETPTMRFRPVNAWGIPTGATEEHDARPQSRWATGSSTTATTRCNRGRSSRCRAAIVASRCTSTRATRSTGVRARGRRRRRASSRWPPRPTALRRGGYRVVDAGESADRAVLDQGQSEPIADVAAEPLRLPHHHRGALRHHGDVAALPARATAPARRPSRPAATAAPRPGWSAR